MEARAARDTLRSPISIYEVHLGSWRRVPEERNRSLTYRELAPALGDYVTRTGLHARRVDARDGASVQRLVGLPGERLLRADFALRHARRFPLLRRLSPSPRHRRDPRLGAGAFSHRRLSRSRRFDGTALYEHLDPRQGDSIPNGALTFSTSAAPRCATSCSAAREYWLREFHADGLRVDAVASMLYLDYARREGEWIPNADGRTREPRGDLVPARCSTSRLTRAIPAS